MASVYNKNSGFYNVKNYDDRGFKLNQTGQTAGQLNEQIARDLSRGIGAVNAAHLNSTPASSATTNSGSTSGSGKGTGTGVKGSNMSGYLSSLYGSYAQNRQQALDDAYNRSRANIENAFGESRGLLDSNYNSARDAMNGIYNNNLKNLRADASKSLREAYVNRMLSEKNLAQQMAAQGLSGGATETTMANMYNNYGNARNNINTTLNRNIADLGANRDQQMASILQNYNNNLANLIQQRANALANAENAYANGQMDMLDKQFDFQTSSGYMKALNDAVGNMGAQEFAATMANNPVNLASTQQTGVDNITNATNYEALQRLLEALMAQQTQ